MSFRSSLQTLEQQVLDLTRRVQALEGGATKPKAAPRAKATKKATKATKKAG